MRQNLEQGKLKIFLRGERLKGSWALVKMANRHKQWLLIKHSDQFASTSDVLKEGDSVASGLSLEEIKKGTKRPAKKSALLESKEIKQPTKRAAVQLKEIKGAEKAAFPGVFSPMLATSGKKPFSDPDWIFEPKLDGYRVLAFVKKGKAKLISRNGIDVSDQYPAIMSDLDKLPPKDYILDGEVVALDRSGRPRFQYLQNRLNLKSTGHSEFQIVYYIFDLLYLDGYDLRSVALSRRKEVLAKAVAPSGHVRLIEYLEKEGESLYEASIKIGLEGVVAKRNDSLYEVGRRSDNWVKIKSVLSDEFIIGGYTQGTGNRTKTFGSLLLGSYDENKKLIFVGHVGTGYDTELLASLKKRLDALRSSRNPFSENPPLNGQTTWVKPELAAEVKFAERTQEGILRAPVFLRLREDKPLSEIRVAESAAVSTDNQEGGSALNKKSTKKGISPPISARGKRGRRFIQKRK